MYKISSLWNLLKTSLINKKKFMKIVKQMLGAPCIKTMLVVHIMIFLFYIWNPSLCLQRLKRLRSHNSLSPTNLHPSGASDSQDTTELLQRAHNNQQSLTLLCIGNTNLSNTLVHISVAKATWCRTWTIHNKFLWYLSTFRYGLLSLPTLHGYSSCLNIFLHVHSKCR